MGTISDLYKAVRPMSLVDVVERSFRGNELVLINYNQMQLYEKSVLATGANLALYRNQFYALDKSNRNPKPGFMHPDLYDTGDFYKGFYLTVTAQEYEIDSKDSKSGRLKQKYGDTIFGLTDQNKALFASNEFFNTFSRIIQSQTGLVFSK